MKGTLGGDKVKDSDAVTESSRRIARETSDLAYRWDSYRDRKKEIVDDGISVD